MWVMFICTCGVHNHTVDIIEAYDHIEDCDNTWMTESYTFQAAKSADTWITLVRSLLAQYVVSLQHEVCSQLIRGHQCPGKCGDNPLEGGVGKLKRLWEGWEGRPG